MPQIFSWVSPAVSLTCLHVLPDSFFRISPVVLREFLEEFPGSSASNLSWILPGSSKSLPWVTPGVFWEFLQELFRGLFQKFLRNSSWNTSKGSICDSFTSNFWGFFVVLSGITSEIPLGDSRKCLHELPVNSFRISPGNSFSISKSFSRILRTLGFLSNFLQDFQDFFLKNSSRYALGILQGIPREFTQQFIVNFPRSCSKVLHEVPFRSPPWTIPGVSQELLWKYFYELL